MTRPDATKLDADATEPNATLPDATRPDWALLSEQLGDPANRRDRRLHKLSLAVSNDFWNA